ncbi:titin homolog [Aplysia californica]|uniref:Titin homolog n=1 Tax=Aplysia californica TaxID=6500 RepID=A0ABM0JDJ9_APLCA|nr:titin homolog [Aplysia californica]
MGQSSSKRRSYTPGQEKGSQVSTSRANGDIKTNGSFEVHEDHDDTADTETPITPTSLTSASSTTGKKEKKRKLRFIGFSLKRTPSGRWSRKRRNNTPNGTARPVSCPNPIPEHGEAGATGERPQSLFLDELVITEEDSKIETVDLSDHDEDGKPKTKSTEKAAPKPMERTKGKRGSQKKGSKKKKKEKQSAKKEKQKKSKKSTEAPTAPPRGAAAAAAAAPTTNVVATAASGVAADVEEKVVKAASDVTTKVEGELKAELEAPEACSSEIIVQAPTGISVETKGDTAEFQRTEQSADVITSVVSSSVEVPFASVEQNSGHTGDLEAMASSIVAESVNLAQKRLQKESGNENSEIEKRAALESNKERVSVDSPLENKDGGSSASFSVNSVVGGFFSENEPQTKTVHEPQNIDSELELERMDSEVEMEVQVQERSLVDEVLNAVNAEVCNSSAQVSYHNSSTDNITADVTDVTTDHGVDASTNDDGTEDQLPVASLVADIERDMKAIKGSSLLGKTESLEVPQSSADTSLVADTKAEASFTGDTPEKGDLDCTDTSITLGADEAISVARKAENEVKALVAFSGISASVDEETTPVEEANVSAEKNTTIETTSDVDQLGVAGISIPDSVKDISTGSLDVSVAADAVQVQAAEKGEVLAKAAVEQVMGSAVVTSVSASVAEGGKKEEGEEDKKLEAGLIGASAERLVSDSEAEKALKLQAEKERRDKERIEKEKLKKQREEEKMKEREKAKEEKRRKAEQKAAEKAEKEKQKQEKKMKVPKKLSSWFSKKEKQPRTVAELEVKAPGSEDEAVADSTLSDSSPPTSPDTPTAPEQHTSADTQVCPVSDAVAEVKDVVTSVGIPAVTSAVSSEVTTAVASAVTPEEQPSNASLTVDVSVEPLIKPSTEPSEENSPNSSAPAVSSEPSSPEHQDSAPTSPFTDNGSGSDSERGSGVLKKISIGPRLRTAILRKRSSGASDSGHEENRLSLTKPKAVEATDITPPPRKIGPRRPVEQYSPITAGAHNKNFPTEASSAVQAKEEVASEAISKSLDFDTSVHAEVSAADSAEHENSPECAEDVSEKKKTIVEEVVSVAKQTLVSCEPLQGILGGDNSSIQSRQDNSLFSIAEVEASSNTDTDLKVVTDSPSGEVNVPKEKGEEGEKEEDTLVDSFPPLESPTLVSTATIVLRANSIEDSVIEETQSSLAPQSGEATVSSSTSPSEPGSEGNSTQVTSEIDSAVQNVEEKDSIVESIVSAATQFAPSVLSDKTENTIESYENVPEVAGVEDFQAEENVGGQDDDEKKEEEMQVQPQKYSVVCVAQTIADDMTQEVREEASPDNDNVPPGMSDESMEKSDSSTKESVKDVLATVAQTAVSKVEAHFQDNTVPTIDTQISETTEVAENENSPEVADASLAASVLQTVSSAIVEQDDTKPTAVENGQDVELTFENEAHPAVDIGQTSSATVESDSKSLTDTIEQVTTQVAAESQELTTGHPEVKADRPTVTTVAEFQIGILSSETSENEAEENADPRPESPKADPKEKDAPDATEDTERASSFQLNGSVNDEAAPVLDVPKDDADDKSVSVTDDLNGNNKALSEAPEEDEKEKDESKEGGNDDDDNDDITCNNNIIIIERVETSESAILPEGVCEQEMSETEATVEQAAETSTVISSSIVEEVVEKAQEISDSAVDKNTAEEDGERICDPEVVNNTMNLVRKSSGVEIDTDVVNGNDSGEDTHDMCRTGPNATIEAYLKLQYADTAAEKNAVNGDSLTTPLNGNSDEKNKNNGPILADQEQEQTTG